VVCAWYAEPVASVEARDARAIEITLVGLTEPVRSGMTYPVTFTFEHAGSLALSLPVETPTSCHPAASRSADHSGCQPGGNPRRRSS
jgi:hypothetical protein